MLSPSKKIALIGFVFLLFCGPQFVYSQKSKEVKSKTGNEKKPIIPTKTAKTQENEKKIFESKAGQQIFKRQGARRDELKTYKKMGYIGETSSGLISVRDLKSVNEKLKAKILKKVEIENKDRTMMYKAMIKKNNYNANEEKVFKNSMFKSHLERDPKGVYYLEDKEWIKKI